ncbi:hypothetical protein VAWG004_22600 [Aeromonas veronii]|nr:hypothetical protein VAWG002_21550 [Aeromonas veronii]BEE13757.1 hypothetical protein VAWG004_22600 [Aeromonas veronii]
MFFVSFKALIPAGKGKSLVRMVEPAADFDYTGARISHSPFSYQVFKVFYGSQGNRIQGPDQFV